MNYGYFEPSTRLVSSWRSSNWLEPHTSYQTCKSIVPITRKCSYLTLGSGAAGSPLIGSDGNRSLELIICRE